MTVPGAAAALAHLAACWRSYWPDSDPERMAADVAARLDAAAADWSLSGLRVLGPGNAALVCAARCARGHVVVKVNPRGHREDGRLALEGCALRFWAGTAAAAVPLDSRDDGLTLLLERLLPGDSLEDEDWEAALVTLGRLARRLHAAGDPGPSFTALADYMGDWRAALARGPGLLDELDGLLAAGAAPVLVHADLHPGNALLDGGSWRAIDPHAVRGDRHADVWALVTPGLPGVPDDASAARPEARRRVALYAAAAGLEPERAAAWTRMRALAEALSEPGTAWAERLARLAAALERR